MITMHSFVLFTVRTLVFDCTLLIITYLQYLLLLTEVLFTVIFTDRVFTVHYYINSVQVLFTDYYALDLLFLDNGLLWSIA
jgi:hypothetical protein